MNGDTQPTLAALFDELVEIDQQLVDEYEQLQQAQARFAVVSTKFAAVRAAITGRMRKSPYARQRWVITRRGQRRTVAFASGGQFRFLNMPLGDVVEEVLSEADGAMSLEDIVAIVRAGLPEDSWVGARSVNAALTNKVDKTIYKTDDGKYSKQQPKSEAEEFEAQFGGMIATETDGTNAGKQQDDLEDLPF